MLTDSTLSAENQAAGLADEIDSLALRLSQLRQSIGRVIFGQQEVVDQTLTAILADGHALLVGLPGLAKTKLVETIGAVVGLDTKRVQ